MAESRGQSILFALLGLNRAGTILYVTLVVSGLPTPTNGCFERLAMETCRASNGPLPTALR